MWVLKGASFIDTPWRVVMNRATLVGRLLARLLMSAAHGGVPVTLLGYSMGARSAVLPFLTLSDTLLGQLGCC